MASLFVEELFGGGVRGVRIEHFAGGKVTVRAGYTIGSGLGFPEKRIQTTSKELRSMALLDGETHESFAKRRDATLLAVAKSMISRKHGLGETTKRFVSYSF